MRSTLTLIVGQYRRWAMLVGMDVILLLVQHLHALTRQFKLRNKLTVLGCLKSIRSLMLMFYRKTSMLMFVEKNPAVVKYSAMQPVVCLQSKEAPHVHSFFLAKQSIFNILINLHAICILHIVQQIEVELVGPRSSCNSFHQTTQVLQKLLVNCILDFD